MSALDALLGRSPLAIRTFRVNGIPIHLQEDQTAEVVIVSSVPGSLAAPEWAPGFGEEAWRDVRPHPVFPGTLCAVLIERDSARVSLADACPRAWLDHSTFEAFVFDHVDRHREWDAFLRSESQPAY